MEAIDPRIAMGFAPTTQIEQPVNSLARLLQVQGLQQQNQLGQMKMDEYRSGVERKNKLAALLGGQYETDEAREDALLRGGFMDEAQQARKSRLEALKAGADVGKTNADTEKVRLQTAIDKVGFIGQLLNGVNDPVSYARAREAAAANGLDVSQIPEQYDPAQVEQSKARALSVQQQLEQMWKQKGYDLDVQKFGETKRSNLASEANTRRGQDITVRGQNMTDARAREKNSIDRDAIGKVDWKQGVNGEWVGLPKEVNSKGPVVPVTTTVPGKRETQANNALNILSEAEKLIDKATGSYLGAGVDMAARAVGGSFESGDAIAQLQALEGALMMAQPRMEGPQSDKDVALYRQMAGRIGDPTVPASQKRAAINTIKSIHGKYANAPQDPSGGVNIDALLEKYK